MRTHLIVALAAAAGSAAAASAQQATFTVTWQVDAVNIADPTQRIVDVAEIGPGYKAEFIASWSFTPPVGTWVTNHNNRPGYVDGFASVFGDLHASAGHQGTFSPATDGSIAGLLFHGGDVTADALLNIHHGQQATILMPLTHNQDSLTDAFRITWMPANYANRTVDFHFVKSASAEDYAAQLYIFAMSTPFYTHAFYRIPNENFTGGSISLQVIPAPSGLALLGFGALFAARRRRG